MYWVKLDLIKLLKPMYIMSASVAFCVGNHTQVDAPQKGPGMRIDISILYFRDSGASICNRMAVPIQTNTRECKTLL